MSKRNYDIDFASKLEGNKLITHHSQDCQVQVDQVEQLKKVDGGNKSFGKHVARIPQVLFMQWGLEDAGDKLAYLQGRHNNDPELARKLAIRLNSNEFQALRVWEGDISSTDIVKEGNKINK